MIGIFCEFSGIVREAFRKQGLDAWSIDLLETEIPSPYHIIGDARLILLQHPWEMAICFPPCTYLAVSGARWFKDRKEQQQKAIEFARFFLDSPIQKVAVENPIGVLSTYIRKPDQIVQPWMFGHGETKATCLWLKNLPKLQPTNIVNGREGRVWKESPSPNRWKNRSRTYQGLAEAMANQWGKIVLTKDTGEPK